MKLDRRSLFFVSALLGLPLSTATADNHEPPPKISGLIFSHYHYTLSETPDSPNNQFAIDRVYLNFNAAMTPDFSARVTTDIGPIKNSDDQRLRSYLKYAYVEYTGLGRGLKLRFGAAETGFIGKHDGFVGQRWLQRAFTDQTRLLSSSDLGLHVHGKHGNGRVDYQLSIINGGGYDNTEKDDGKAAQLRITVDPLSGGPMNLPISVFVSQDVGNGQDPSGGAIPTGRVLGTSMGFKHKRGLLWAEYVQATHGDTRSTGYSLTVLPKLTPSQSLYARVDSLDPDTNTDGDASTRVLLGLTYHFTQKISGGLLYERRIPEDGDASHGVYLKTQTGF